MNSPPVRPFPWRSLDATTRAEAGTLRDLKRWAAGHVRLERVAASLAELVDADVRIVVGRVGAAVAARPIEGGVGVVLARADTPGLAAAALVEVEPSLAASVVARALKRAGPRVVDGAASLAPELAGALAAVVAAAARRAHAGVALRVLDAGPAAAVGEAFARADVVAATLTVLVGDDAFAARVLVPRDALARSSAPRWDADALAALGPTPLAVPVVACASFAPLAELEALGPGDAFVLPLAAGLWPLSRGAGGGAVGPVLLAPAGATIGLPAQLVDGGRVMVRGGPQPLLAVEAGMDPQDRETLVAALGDVPVVVRVEVGEAVMAARDWASLGQGDVVALGRRVGEPVVLRVEGVELARGELVDLEGEVAVRILERLGAGGAAR